MYARASYEFLFDVALGKESVTGLMLDLDREGYKKERVPVHGIEVHSRDNRTMRVYFERIGKI